MQIPSDAFVLIAEDDKALSMVHRILFQDQGIAMEMVENGEQAIAAIDKQQPDLLLLDLLMPKKDGFAVLKHCKEKGYAFPVVVLTNLSSENDKKECYDLGARDVIVKSDADSNQLTNIVWKYVAR